MRHLILGLLALAATVHATPLTAGRCARACRWAAKHCGAFGNPTPRRCVRRIIARCNATVDRACSRPSTTSTTTGLPTTTSTGTVIATTTVMPTSSTTTTILPDITGRYGVTLDLVDDCASAKSCQSGDGEPKVCADPPSAHFDTTLSIVGFAADATASFTVHLEPAPEWPAIDCAGGNEPVCYDDPEASFCVAMPVATCEAPSLRALVLGRGTYVRVLVGAPYQFGCNDVWEGPLVRLGDPSS